MALVEVCGAEKPIVFIPGHSGERRVVDIVARLSCMAGLAVSANTFLNTILGLRTGSDDDEK